VEVWYANGCPGPSGGLVLSHAISSARTIKVNIIIVAIRRLFIGKPFKLHFFSGFRRLSGLSVARLTKVYSRIHQILLRHADQVDQPADEAPNDQQSGPKNPGMFTI
jgi:hypothetical protein